MSAVYRLRVMSAVYSLRVMSTAYSLRVMSAAYRLGHSITHQKELLSELQACDECGAQLKGAHTARARRLVLGRDLRVVEGGHRW